MPELPEVQTVIDGLIPFVKGSTIKKLILNRKNLRFDFPKDFIKNLEGKKIDNISRRAKYLLFSISNDATLISHLGMSGNFRILEKPLSNDIIAIKHAHVIFSLIDKNQNPLTLIYTDARRFGFMDLSFDIENNRFLEKLGVEPLGNQFNAQYLAQRFKGRKLPIKTALLDQSIIAGLGNIYVCEALWRAKIHPQTPIKDLMDKYGRPTNKLDVLSIAIVDILNEAIKAGGSTLKDFSNISGEQGYFQHSFDVYGQEGRACSRKTGNKKCSGNIQRISQSGRSSFFCPKCQIMTNKPVDLML